MGARAGLAGYPVFTRKVNTDVSYLAATRALLARPDCFYPQFATHNAHTIAAIVTLAGDRPYEFQRLYGMGEALHREVVRPERLAKPCRIYAPVGGHRDLLAYLVRRLLENGANTSFVNRLADDEAPIEAIVADPVEKAAALPVKANPLIPPPPDLFMPERKNSLGLPLWHEFGARAVACGDAAHACRSGEAPIPSFRAESCEEGGELGWITSPHDRRVVVGTCRSAGPEAIDKALAAARAASEDWDRAGRRGPRGDARPRRRSVRGGSPGADGAAGAGGRQDACQCASRSARGGRSSALLGGASAGGNSPARGSSKARPARRTRFALHGRGVFACISPWNFPLAIFTGQIAGALAAGNAVVAKPAEQTPLVAARAVRLLHRAGIPPDVLHFLAGHRRERGCGPRQGSRASTASPSPAATDTGVAINRALAARDGPIVKLIAETGGLNAMIVDSSALPEQVVDDALASAFDSAGQRCSALRVLFLQDDVADATLNMLIGAARELRIGDPFDYATDVGPVIDEEARAALEAHKLRMRKEARELVDLPLGDEHAQGTYVSPAIYEIPSISVLQREVFGPILHVVRFSGDRLAEVCEAINATGYGLTLGLHSRIKATADFVAERVKVGNLYVNRNQIGAVVGVQPFGGEGLSGTGPKAGGPSYLEAFALERVRSTDLTASGGNASLLAAGSDVV